MVYEIRGWAKRTDIALGSCCFSVMLDARFAERARAKKLSSEQQHRILSMAREIIGYNLARVSFFEDTALVQSVSVEGDCACLGVSGRDMDDNWSQMTAICYGGHNIDSREQAYDLLAIFLLWIDVIGFVVDTP